MSIRSDIAQIVPHRTVLVAAICAIATRFQRASRRDTSSGDASVGGCVRTGGDAACGPGAGGNDVYTMTISAWSGAKGVKRGAVGAGG